MEENRTPTQLMWDIARAYRERKPHEEIMAIYDKFTDPDAVSDDRGETVIHIAAQAADPLAIEYLLNRGAKAGTKNRYQETALHALAKGDNSSCVERSAEDIEKCAALLLGARVSALMRDDGAGGNLCYHAALKGNACAPFVQAMIKNKVKLDMLDKEGRNLLHIIACYPAKSARHSLHYSNNNPEKEKEALDELEESFVLAQALIEYGLDPEAKDQCQKSPADYAVEYELNKLAVLFNGEYDTSDPTLEDRITAGGQSLHQAVKAGDLAAVQALIRLGADVNEVNTTPYSRFQNTTPLSIACSNLKLDCAKTLIDAGADPNFRGGEDDRGIFYRFVTGIEARGSDQERNNAISQVVKMLFDAGLDPNGAVDAKGNTPLNLSCSDAGSDRYTKLILRDLLDRGDSDLNLPNKEGVTPLMHIVQTRWDTPENELISLLEFGADMTAKDSEGNTALIYAARNRNHGIAMAVVDLMFSFGDPLPDAVNNEGKSAMDYAVEMENENLVKFLLSKM